MAIYYHKLHCEATKFKKSNNKNDIQYYIGNN